MENIRGRGSAEARHERRKPPIASAMRPREDPVRHVIVGLWLILVRMSASVHASESKPTSETISGNPDREASFAIGIRHLRHRPDPYAVSARARRGTRNCYISLFSYVCGPPLALTRRRPLRGSSLRRLARAAGAQRASLSADDDWRAGFGKEQTRRPAAVGRRDPDVGCRR